MPNSDSCSATVCSGSTLIRFDPNPPRSCRDKRASQESHTPSRGKALEPSVESPAPCAAQQHLPPENCSLRMHSARFRCFLRKRRAALARSSVSDAQSVVIFIFSVRNGSETLNLIKNLFGLIKSEFVRRCVHAVHCCQSDGAWIIAFHHHQGAEPAIVASKGDTATRVRRTRTAA